MITVKALHTISGQVADVPVKYIGHPVLGQYLVAVDDEVKSYAPELYKPKSVEEFTSTPKRGRKAKSEQDEQELEESNDTSTDEDN